MAGDYIVISDVDDDDFEDDFEADDSELEDGIFQEEDVDGQRVAKNTVGSPPDDSMLPANLWSKFDDLSTRALFFTEALQCVINWWSTGTNSQEDYHLWHKQTEMMDKLILAHTCVALRDSEHLHIYKSLWTHDVTVCKECCDAYHLSRDNWYKLYLGSEELTATAFKAIYDQMDTTRLLQAFGYYVQTSQTDKWVPIYEVLAYPELLETSSELSDSFATMIQMYDTYEVDLSMPGYSSGKGLLLIHPNDIVRNWATAQYSKTKMSVEDFGAFEPAFSRVYMGKLKEINDEDGSIATKDNQRDNKRFFRGLKEVLEGFDKRVAKCREFNDIANKLTDQITSQLSVECDYLFEVLDCFYTLVKLLQNKIWYYSTLALEDILNGLFRNPSYLKLLKCLDTTGYNAMVATKWVVPLCLWYGQWLKQFDGKVSPVTGMLFNWLVVVVNDTTYPPDVRTLADELVIMTVEVFYLDKKQNFILSAADVWVKRLVAGMQQYNTHTQEELDDIKHWRACVVVVLSVMEKDVDNYIANDSHSRYVVCGKLWSEVADSKLENLPTDVVQHLLISLSRMQLSNIDRETFEYDQRAQRAFDVFTKTLKAVLGKLTAVSNRQYIVELFKGSTGRLRETPGKGYSTQSVVDAILIHFCSDNKEIRMLAVKCFLRFSETYNYLDVHLYIQTFLLNATFKVFLDQHGLWMPQVIAEIATITDDSVNRSVLGLMFRTYDTLHLMGYTFDTDMLNLEKHVEAQLIKMDDADELPSDDAVGSVLTDDDSYTTLQDAQDTPRLYATSDPVSEVESFKAMSLLADDKAQNKPSKPNKPNKLTPVKKTPAKTNTLFNYVSAAEDFTSMERPAKPSAQSSAQPQVQRSMLGTYDVFRQSTGYTAPKKVPAKKKDRYLDMLKNRKPTENHYKNSTLGSTTGADSLGSHRMFGTSAFSAPSNRSTTKSHTSLPHMFADFGSEPDSDDQPVMRPAPLSEVSCAPKSSLRAVRLNAQKAKQTVPTGPIPTFTAGAAKKMGSFGDSFSGKPREDPLATSLASWKPGGVSATATTATASEHAPGVPMHPAKATTTTTTATGNSATSTTTQTGGKVTVLAVPSTPTRAEKERTARSKVPPPPVVIVDLFKQVLMWHLKKAEKDDSLSQLVVKDDKPKDIIPLAFDSYAHYRKTFTPFLIVEFADSLKSESDFGVERIFGTDGFCLMDMKKAGEFWLLTFAPSQAVMDCEFAVDDVVVVSRPPDKTTDGKAGAPVIDPKTGLPPHILGLVQEKPRHKADKDNNLIIKLHYTTEMQKTFRVGTLTGNFRLQQQLHICQMANIRPIIRQYEALLKCDNAPLMNFVIRPKRPKMVLRGDLIANAATKHLLTKYNEPQLNAICNSIAHDGITMIQGPPGTGKTRTILGLLAAYFKQPHLPRRSRVLLCAPSNAAVDEVVRRILAVGLDMGGETKHPVIVRVGVESKMDERVLSRSWNILAKDLLDELNCKRDRLRELRQETWKLYEEAKRLAHERRAHLKDTGAPNPQEDFRMVELNRAMLGAKTSYLTAKKALETMNKDFNRLREQERKNILEGAEIIATTLNGSGNQAYVRAGIDIGFTVIDEAAQSTELDVLIALQHNGRKCVMVGDPNQLPATVQSQVSKDLGYDRSMFRRMQLYFMQQPDNIKSPVELLTVQYRMHPEIAAFPSKHFYNGQLRDHHTTFNMPETPVYQHVFGPYMFANVKGMEERSHGSYINQQEAVEALALFIWVCLSCKATGFSGRVGIVTPYSAQKKLIRQKFCSFFSGDSILSHVEIDSVDSYQGREKDIIILSCVRASHSGNIGFLNDVRRLNVALTRAKHCMWVLGNAELLSRDKDSYVFKELADDARERNIMRDDSPWTPYSDSRKHKPPANAMKLDAQIGLALPKATSGYRAMAYESSNMDVDAIPPRLQDRVDRGSVERVREALPPSLQDRVGPSSVDRAGRDSTADERKGSGLGGGGEERTTMVSAVQAKYSQPADRNRHSSAHGVGPSSRGQDSRDRTKTPDIRDTHLSRKRDSHAPDAPDRRARGGSGGRSSRGSSNEIRGHTAKRTRGEEADGNQDRKHARTDTGRRRDEDRSTNTAKHLDKQQNPKAKAKGSGSADGNEMEEGEIDETHTGAGKGKGKEGVARTTSQRDHSHTREDSSARARDRRGSRDSRGSRDDARATTGDGEHAKQLKRSHSQDTKDYANDRVTQLRQEGGRDSRAQPLTQNDGTGFKQSKGQMNNVKHPSNSTKQPMKQSKGQMNNAKHPSNSTKQPMKQSKEQKNNVKQATNNTKQPNSNRLVRESVPNYRQEGDQHPSSRTYVYTNQPGNCKPHSKHPGPQGGPKAAPEGKESFRKGSRVDTVGGSSGERGSSANESANADRQLGEALRENRPKKKPRQAKKSTPPSFLDELLGSMKNDYKNPGGKRQVGRDHI